MPQETHYRTGVIFGAHVQCKRVTTQVPMGKFNPVQIMIKKSNTMFQDRLECRCLGSPCTVLPFRRALLDVDV